MREQDAVERQVLSRKVAVGRKPVMRQRWQELLFAHWRVDAREIRARLPDELEVDVFDGSAWLGLVPFWMKNVRPVWCPALPWISHFLELNVRTYVIGPDGVPGVWFFSLDCNRWPAVEIARAGFKLPYFHATMSAEQADCGARYACRRRGGSAGEYRWQGQGIMREAEPGSLEFFLLERYWLYSAGRGRLFRGQVEHVPYPFQDARLGEWSAAPLEDDGFEAPGREPDHVCRSPGVDVRVYPLEAL